MGLNVFRNVVVKLKLSHCLYVYFCQSLKHDISFGDVLHTVTDFSNRKTLHCPVNNEFYWVYMHEGAGVSLVSIFDLCRVFIPISSNLEEFNCNFYWPV